MNTKEREILAIHYENYLVQAMRGDPVGGFCDLRGLFDDLRKGDKKLDKLLDEVYDDLPETFNVR